MVEPESTEASAETHQLVWITEHGGHQREGFMAVHAIPAGISQRARRTRVGKLLVQHGAERRTIKHNADDYSVVETSVGSGRRGLRPLAFVLPAGTAQVIIHEPLFPGRPGLEVTLMDFTVDGHTNRRGKVQVDVFDPVLDPYRDPEDRGQSWEQGDLRRWLDWTGLEPVEPGPIRLNEWFTVRTQVASLQAR